jgi:hypothetical protein
MYQCFSLTSDSVSEMNSLTFFFLPGPKKKCLTGSQSGMRRKLKWGGARSRLEPRNQRVKLKSGVWEEVGRAVSMTKCNT